jgi:hypothetical protein
VNYETFVKRLQGTRLPLPKLLHVGEALSIAKALELLGKFGHHGATDPVEGAVWRVERKGAVDFLGKYVTPDKGDGCYLPEISDGAPIWNWRPRLREVALDYPARQCMTSLAIPPVWQSA